MKNQPSRGYTSNDGVQTPRDLARRIVDRFQPTGRILEPCRGDGSFYLALTGWAAAHPSVRVEWCEIREGRDFFERGELCDWIVTNPPWSQVRRFLQHGMRLAENVVFLMTVNHCWTRARVRDVREAGFGIQEICLLDYPRSFPQTGFQLGAIHFRRGHRGSIRLTELGKGVV